MAAVWIDEPQAATDQGGPTAGAGGDQGPVWIDEAGQRSVDTPQTDSGWGNVASGVGAGLRGAGAALASVAADAASGDAYSPTAERLRNTSARAMFEKQMYEKMAGEGGIPQDVSDIHGIGDVARYAGGQLASAAPQVALYGAGSLGGAPGLAAAYGADVALRGSENIANRIASGKPEDVGTSFAFAMPTAALDMGGSGSIVKGGLSKAVADSVGGNIVKRGLTGAATEAGEQAVVGGAQTATSELGSGDEVSAKDVVAGGLGNAAFGAPIGAVHGLRSRGTEEPVKPPVPDGTRGSFDMLGDQKQTAVADTDWSQYNRPAAERNAGPQQPRAGLGPDIYARDAAARADRQQAGAAAQAGQLDLRGGEGGAPEPHPGQGPLPPEQHLPGDQHDLFDTAQKGLDLTGGEGPRMPPAAPQGPLPAAAERTGTQGALDFNQPSAGPRGSTYADQSAIDRLQGITQPDATPPAIATPTRPPIEVPPAAPRTPPPLSSYPPRVQEILRKGMEAEAAEARAKVAAGTGQVQLPAAPERGFKLQAAPPGESWASRARRGATTPAAEGGFELTPSESGHPGQRELDLGSADEAPVTPPAVAMPGQRELLAPTQGGLGEWQAKVRDAYRAVQGNMQGIQGLAKILKATDPEHAAELVREKANDAGGTSFAKLDAIHKALTGETLEEHAVRTAKEGESNGVEETSHPAAEGKASGSEEAARTAEGESPASGEGTTPQTEAASNAADATDGGQRSTDATDGGTGRGSAADDVTGAAPEAMDAVEQARAAAPEQRPGLRKLARETAAALGSRGETAEQRATRIETLSHIANLERDKEAVDFAREALDDMTTPEEQAKAMEATKVEAAERLSQDVRGEFREGTGAEAASPHDTELFEKAANGMTLKEGLQHVAENHPDANVRELAKNLLDKVGDETVRHGTDAEREAAPDGALGEQKGSEVILHSAQDAGQTLVHEAAHAATVRAIDAGGPAAVTMGRLYAEAQKVTGLAKEYGLKNVKEFVAEAFSNPAFRDALDNIKSPAGSLWERFKSAVKRILGMKDESMLDRVMKAGGELVDENQKAAFGHTDGTPEAVYRQVESGTATGWTNAAGDMATNLYKDVAKEKLRNVFIASMPTHTIVKTYKAILPALTKLQKVMDERINYIGEMQRRATAVYNSLEQARKAAGSANRDRLNRFVNDIQVAGGMRAEDINPTQAQYALRRAQESYNRTRASKPDDLVRLRAEDDLLKARAAASARAAWDEMTPKERDAANAIFDNLHETHKIRLDELDNMLGDRKMLRPFSEFKAYAPLKRYGDWVVSVKSKAFQEAEATLAEARKTGDADAIKEAKERVELMTRNENHRSVVNADTQREAAAKAEQLKGVLGEGAQVHTFERADMHKTDTGYRDPMVADMLDKVDNKFGGTAAADDLRKIVYDTYIDYLPDGSSAALAAHRQLVSGWSTDFGRAALDRLGRDAFQIGTMKYAQDMASTMKEVATQAKEDGGVPANSAYKALASRIRDSANYGGFSKAERMVANMTHDFYLGASPAFMLVNMLQTPMIAAPVIAGRHGFGAAMGAVMKATADVNKATTMKDGFSMEKAGHMAEREQQMLHQMQNMQLLDLTATHQMAKQARGERIVNPQNPGEAATMRYEQGREMLQRPVTYIESLNRGGTALGAYRLEYTKLINREVSPEEAHARATSYAADVLRDSHVDYGAQANSAMFRAPYARVALQFKKFGLTMFHMLNQQMRDAYGNPAAISKLTRDIESGRLTGDALKEAKESLQDFQDRKAQARRTLTGLIAMHQLFAGSMGLPFAGAGFTAADIIRGWMGDNEEAYDTRADFQNYLAHGYGTDVATLVARGIPAALLGVDISKRAGLGDVAPFSSMIGQVNQSIHGGNPDLFEPVLMSMIGPAGGVGQQFAKGFEKFAQGEYAEGAANMMPRAIFNAWNALKMADEGVKVGGQQVAAPINGMHEFKEFLGLPDTAVQEAKDAAFSEKREKSQFQQTRNRLVANWLKSGDTSMPDDVKSFNERNPQNAVYRTDVVRQQQKEQRASLGAKPPTSAKQRALAARAQARGAFAEQED